MLLTTEIMVADIVANAAMLMRVKIDRATVTRYTKEMEAGAQFPPILIFRVDDELILADGFHRHSAYQKLGLEKIQAEVRVGTLDDAILAAVKADAHEGLQRTPADKEKGVKALLACERWRAMSDREIAREAGVGYSLVAKLRKVSIQLPAAGSSIAANRETRRGKDGKLRPAHRSRPAAAPAVPSYKPPPLPTFTREQIGAPAAGTEDEQDPDSPPGVTRGQAFTAKHGHVHIRPLNEKLRAEKEKRATSFVSALRDFAKPTQELMKHAMEPTELLAALQDMSGRAMRDKFTERMDAIEPMLTLLTAINAMRAKKAA